MKKCMQFIISVLLVLVIAVCIGCGNQKIGKENQVGKKEDVSFKSSPDTLENPNLSLMMTEESRVIEEFTDAIADFEKKYGGKVNITYVAQGEKDQKIIAAITSGSSYDLIRWTAVDMPRYAVKGILQPINDLIDLDDPVWEYGLKASQKGWYKGKLYGMCAEPQVGLLYYNKTIFENNGLKTPLELFNEGKWNWETLREAASKLTQRDPGGSLQLKGLAIAANAVDFFILANQSNMVQISPEGEITMNILDPNVIEALQFYQDLTYKDESLFMATMAASAADFVAGKLAMYISWDEQSKGDTFANFKGEWGIVPVPTGPSGSKEVLAGGGASYGILSGAPNPKGGAVIMWLRQKHSNEDIEARLLRMNYTPEFAKLLIEWRRQPLAITKSLGIGDWNKVSNQLFAELRKGVPVVSALEQFAPKYQEEINAILQ